jgi:hypothetical protein
MATAMRPQREGLFLRLSRYVVYLPVRVLPVRLLPHLVLPVCVSTRNGISAGSVNAVDESGGIRTASRMTSIPGMKVQLDRASPATVSAPPASRSRRTRRRRKTRAIRIKPMTASSALTRIPRRIRLLAAGRPVSLLVSAADEFHPVSVLRRDRRLIAASRQLRLVSSIVRFALLEGSGAFSWCGGAGPEVRGTRCWGGRSAAGPE